MKQKSLTEIFIGLAVIAIGIGLFVDALGLLQFSDIARHWWPVAIIAVGIASLLSNPRIWWWPTVVTLVGAVLLLGTLDIVQVNLARIIWPSIIILVGLGILFERGTKARPVSDDEINAFLAFSGNESRSTSQAFKGGKITAIFGGMSLDLNDVKLAKDGASIDVFTLCGGIELRVPDGWVVKVDGLPLLGGWENKTRRPDNVDKAPVLHIRGTCVMGGFSVKNGRLND